MALVDEDEDSVLFKIGVLNHDVFKQWQGAFTQLKNYNRRENEERDQSHGKYQIFKGEYVPPTLQQVCPPTPETAADSPQR